MSRKIESKQLSQKVIEEDFELLNQQCEYLHDDYDFNSIHNSRVREPEVMSSCEIIRDLEKINHKENTDSADIGSLLLFFKEFIFI
jgi:hypothetical protein